MSNFDLTKFTDVPIIIEVGFQLDWFNGFKGAVNKGGSYKVYTRIHSESYVICREES